MRMPSTSQPPNGRQASLAKSYAPRSWSISASPAGSNPLTGEAMSHRSFRLTAAAALLTVASVLAGCSSPKGPDAPLSSAGGSTAANHPEWSQYTFTIGDNGGDGNEELAKITGAFNDAPYKVRFARFDYGPPLVQAAASGNIDLGSVGDVPPITGAATQFGFKIVGVQRGSDQTKAAENIVVPKGSPIQTLSDLKGKKLAVPQGSSAH